MRTTWTGRLAGASAKYGEHAPVATACCNTCRTCVTTSALTVVTATLAGIAGMVHRRLATRT